MYKYYLATDKEYNNILGFKYNTVHKEYKSIWRNSKFGPTPSEINPFEILDNYIEVSRWEFSQCLQRFRGV